MAMLMLTLMLTLMLRPILTLMLMSMSHIRLKVGGAPGPPLTEVRAAQSTKLLWTTALDQLLWHLSWETGNTVQTNQGNALSCRASALWVYQ